MPVGQFLCIDYSLISLSDIPFIRPPLQNVVERSSFDTIFGGTSSMHIFFSYRHHIHPILRFFLETNDQPAEKSVRLKIVDMDDIDEDEPSSTLSSTGN